MTDAPAPHGRARAAAASTASSTSSRRPRRRRAAAPPPRSPPRWRRRSSRWSPAARRTGTTAPGIASQARALRSRLTALGDEDAAAFAHVLATMRDPTGTPEQRDFALGLALLRAAEVPLRIAEAAADVAELAALAAAEGSPHLQPDATAAAALAEAATQAATHLVEINLAIVPGDRHSERAAALAAAAAAARARALGATMSDRMIPAWSLTAEAAASIGIPAEWPERVTREWAIGGATGEGVDVCILDSGVDGDHPLVGGLESAVAVTLDGEETTIVPDDDRRRLRARHGLRRDRPLARAGLPAPQRPRARRGEHRQRRADPRRPPPRDRAALRRRQPQPLDDEAQVRGAPARARRRRLLQRHGARRVGAQHARRELSVALLVGDLGREPRGRRLPGSGTRTRTRRSSSSPAASTSTSRGSAAARSARPATASPRRTSPASRRSCSRSIRA